MNDRDRQNPYGRNPQQGGYRGSDDDYSFRQANQWQSDDHRQQGGNWQQDSGWRSSDEDASREYRFSGQSNASYDAGYQSGMNDDDHRGSVDRYQRDRGGYSQSGQGRYGEDQYDQGQYGQNRDRGESSRQYGRDSYGSQSERGSYDRHAYDRNPYDRSGQQGGSSRSRYGSQQRSAPYAGHNYEASGGNDFGSFTSEDYGGRDFYNRGGGGAVGGMRPSESYRPTYSAARLFDHDDGGRGRDDRGFLARAGDEVASWFGDEDAARRREQDHRGRGPSGYTRSDERIREDANDHLTHDWAVDASNITVQVSNGEVTLDGTVDSRQAKRRAEDCVEHISGVKHVQNNLRVKDRSNSYGSSSDSNSGMGQSGSSYGASAGQGTTGRDTASSGTGSSGTSASSSTGSSSTGSSGTATSTTGGIGSTTTAGVGTANAPRSSDKTS